MSNDLHLSIPDNAPYIDSTREFDFPVADVFRAHTDPALVGRWLGPRRLKMDIDHYDARTGGTYRYLRTGPDGDTYGFSGAFHCVRENELIIQTFEYDGFPDVVSLEFMRFEDLGDGRTRLVGHSVYPSQEARDGMASSGMEEGMQQGYQRLEELLAGQTAD